MQKTIEQAGLFNVKTLMPVAGYQLKITPMNGLAKFGYNMNKFSVYGILGLGTTYSSTNKVGDESGWKMNAVGGAGASVKFSETLSMFTQYTYTRTFLDTAEEMSAHNNAVVVGLQVNF